MSYTQQQQAIIDLVAADLPVNKETELYKVSSVAGSGKTHTLIGIAKAVNPTKGLYIAFNKSVATEAKLKFGKNIDCKTIHALAYQYVIAGTKQKIEEFSIDSIPTKIRPEKKRQIIRAMNDFFNSSELSLSFLDNKLTPKLAEIAKSHIANMVEGTVPATFGFIMKFFYLQLESKAIKIEYDLVMLDEAGDLSEVTIEIFKLLKSPKKVLVGDPFQNIYAFMNTVNGFKIFEDVGHTLTLSQSFRVREDIARGIEKFCQSNLDKKMEFKGVPIEDTDVKSRVFLSRTNGQLINRMIELHDKRLPYKTLREPKDIFALPLALISISSGKPVYRTEFKYLERDYSYFNNHEDIKLQYDHKFHKYLRDIHGDDENLISAIRLLETHSYSKIFETYSLAKNQPKKGVDITLSTAHTSKGGTYDSVYIENDLNNTVKKIIEQGGPETTDEMIELNLYYVAVSRTRIELINAHYI